MTARYEIWYHDDILEDPTIGAPDGVSNQENMWEALRAFCEGRRSKFVDVVVHNTVTGEWHEIAMKNLGWQSDFQQTEKYNFTRERCK